MYILCLAKEKLSMFNNLEDENQKCRITLDKKLRKLINNYSTKPLLQKSIKNYNKFKNIVHFR